MIESIRIIFNTICHFVDELDIENKEEKILELALDLYDVIDPFPNIDLDDEAVKVIMRWLLSLCYSKDMKVS